MIKPTVHAVRDEIEKCTIAGDESLDLTFLANLRKLEAASGKTIVPRLVASFSAVTPARLAALRAAIAAGDAQAVNMASHSLKGSSANLGARRMARLCESMEICGQTDNLEQADSILAALEVEYERVRTALDRATAEV